MEPCSNKWYSVVAIAILLSSFCFIANGWIVAPSLKHHVPSSNSKTRRRQGIICYSTMEKQQQPVSPLDFMMDDDDEPPEIITKESVMKLSSIDIKTKLLDLLPRMIGTPEELRLVEIYINAIEEKYVPAQTLDFLNLAMNGDWQLLFSTNQLGRPISNFRLTEMYQKVITNGLQGNITNIAQWNLAQQTQQQQDNSDDDNDDDDDNDAFYDANGGQSPPASLTFDASGIFNVTCSYKINQGARMIMDLNDHKVELAKGSSLPQDFEQLVGMIYRSMPKELWDLEDEHAIDTTYLDGDLRIVRMTGPKHESIRDIFIRRGSLL